MKGKRRCVLDKALCFRIRKEKRGVEKRNYFIRLQLTFFIWHLFHYLLFPDDNIMSSLFLLPKHFTEDELHACWQSWIIWHWQLLFTLLDIGSFSKYSLPHQWNTSPPSIAVLHTEKQWMLPATIFRAIDPFVCIWTEPNVLGYYPFVSHGAPGCPGDMGKPMNY